MQWSSVFRVSTSSLPAVDPAGVRGPGSVFSVQGSGFRVQGSGFRFQVSGSKVQGSGFRDQGSGVRGQPSQEKKHACTTVPAPNVLDREPGFVLVY